MSNALHHALVANCLGEALIGDENGQRSVRLADLPEVFTDQDDNPLTAAAIRSIDGEVTLRASVVISPEIGMILLEFDAPAEAAA